MHCRQWTHFLLHVPTKANRSELLFNFDIILHFQTIEPRPYINFPSFVYWTLSHIPIFLLAIYIATIVAVQRIVSYNFEDRRKHTKNIAADGTRNRVSYLAFRPGNDHLGRRRQPSIFNYIFVYLTWCYNVLACERRVRLYILHMIRV